MKKRFLAAVLCLTMIFAFSAAPVYAVNAGTSAADQAAQLEKEIAAIDSEMQAYGSSTAVIGSVYEQTPYYIVYGMTVGATLLSGRYYNVIDNPEDGKTDVLGDYIGSHKYLGTIVLNINGKDTVCNHFGSMGDKWYALFDEKAAKEKQLNALLAGPNYLTESELAAYALGDMNTMVMQIGNPYIYAYDEYLPIDENDTAPVIVNGSTLLPIRVIIELSGGSIVWDNTARTAAITLGDDVIMLTAGSTKADVNGKAVTMTTPAQIINSRLMIPVRFVAENLGMDVSWNGETKVVVINNASYTADLLASRLTQADGYYAYTDDAIGCSYKYPIKWGTPAITRSGEYGMYADRTQFTTEYATVLVDCRFQPSDEELERVNNPSGDYETVKLAGDNKGVAAIVKTNDAYSDNTSCGFIYLLGDNGYLVEVYWSLKEMDVGTSETQAAVMDLVSTISIDELVG